MHDHWKLINIQKRERLDYDNVRMPDESLSVYGAGAQLMSLLRNPAWLTFEIPDQLIRKSKLESSASPLIAMPQEIINMVTREIDESGDDDAMVCLALTCGYFFRLLANTMQKKLLNEMGRWAGDRLINLNNLAEVPRGIMSPEEEAEVGDIFTNKAFDKGVPRKHAWNVELNPWHPWPTLDDIPIREIFHAEGLLIQSARATLEKHKDYESIDRFHLFLDFIALPPARLTYEQRMPVIRNIDKKEYFRCDHLASFHEFISNVGEAIAGYCSLKGESDGSTVARPWVGDRFDITHAVRVEGPEWKEVTFPFFCAICDINAEEDPFGFPFDDYTRGDPMIEIARRVHINRTLGSIFRRNPLSSSI
ncbi:hypothetical protein F66182_7854 [Fusarium sp. NRRL 66182]|nr:hypothetical protein F66182_7854 [Fusarium sp. NRRL 66182]